MFEDAIRYPWTGDERLETIAIGGVLSLLGVLIVPTVLVFGYVVRVLRRVSAGETESPPAFGDWESLLVDGLKAFVVAVVYGAVPAIVFTLAVLSWILPFSVTTGGEPAAGPNLFLVAVGLLVLALSLVASVAAVYLVPAAVAAFARTGRLGAAFSLAELRAIAGDRDYAKGWLVAVAVSILASIVGGALSATFAGAVLVPFVSFYGTVASAYAVGAGVSEIPLLEAEDGPGVTERQTA